MSNQARSVDQVEGGQCDECRNGNVRLPMGTVVSPEDAAEFDRASAAWEAEQRRERPDIQPVSRLREDEDAMMREFHRIGKANPHLWRDTEWVPRVYERYAREQAWEELNLSEEETRSEANYRAWIEAGYLAEFDVDRWLEEYERLGFLDEPDPWEAVGH